MGPPSNDLPRGVARAGDTTPAARHDPRSPPGEHGRRACDRASGTTRAPRVPAESHHPMRTGPVCVSRVAPHRPDRRSSPRCNHVDRTLRQSVSQGCDTRPVGRSGVDPMYQPPACTVRRTVTDVQLRGLLAPANLACLGLVRPRLRVHRAEADGATSHRRSPSTSRSWARVSSRPAPSRHSRASACLPNRSSAAPAQGPRLPRCVHDTCDESR